MVQREERSETSRRRPVLLLLFLGTVVALALGLHFGVGTEGPSSKLVVFLGRFHPLAVHLPIGVLACVVVVECLSVVPGMRQRFDPVLMPLLVVLVASGVGAYTLGVLLASNGGYPPHLVRWHRTLAFAGVLGSAAALGAWAAYRMTGAWSYRSLYRAVLVVTIGALGVGAHFGGSMTYGEDYLVRYAPGPLRWLVGSGSAARAASPVKPTSSERRQVRVYADLIQPVLDAKCAECHGSNKVKGGLSVVSLATLRKGGDSGPSIVAGSSRDSPLVRRLLLPEGHEDRMPPAGKPRPTDAEIALLSWWIDRGADPEATVQELLPPEPVRRLLESAQAGSLPNPAPRASSADAARSTSNGGAPSADGDGSPHEAHATVSAAARVVAPPSGSVYAERVAPVLRAYCVGCHGSTKQKGHLRLDSIAGLLRGGASGPAIVAGRAAASPVVQRMRLPIGSDEHMPPANRAQPTTSQVALVAFWIERGADERLPVAELPAELGGVAAVVPSTRRAAQGEGVPTTSRSQAVGFGGAAGAPSARWEPSPDDLATSTPLPPLPDRLALYDDAVARVLDLRCGGCHLGEPLMGGFSIENPAALIATGSIVPGHPEQSELFRRMTLPVDDEDHMPPAKAEQPTTAEIALVQYWIAAGARTDMVISSAELSPLVARGIAELAVPSASASEGDTTRRHEAADAAPRRGGCASCAVGPSSSAVGLPLLFGVLLLGLSFARRRSRRVGF